MADYLWVHLGASRDEGVLYDVAIERKTIGNLLADSGTGNQIKQTRRLRRAGFGCVILLLEGSQWKARSPELQVDGAEIRSEQDLRTYIVREAFAAVHFLEAPDQGYTATLLAALSLLLSTKSGLGVPRLSWMAAIPRPRVGDVSEMLYPGSAAGGPPLELTTLNHIAKSRAGAIDGALEAAEVSASETASFASFEELAAAMETFKNSPATFAVRFGSSLAAARSLRELVACDAQLAKRARVDSQTLQVVETNRHRLRIGPVDGPSFDVVVLRVSGSDFLAVLGSTATGSNACERARAAASKLLKIGALAQPRGPWDVAFLVVDQLPQKLAEATKQGGGPLGTDPRLYVAMVHAEIVMRGVNVKLARTAVDAGLFEDALRSEIHRRTQTVIF